MILITDFLSCTHVFDEFESLSLEQRHHAKTYATGLVAASNKTVAGIAREVLPAKGKRALNKFITEYDWEEQQFNHERLEELQKHGETRWSQNGYIILDDTITQKAGDEVPGVGHLYDHAEGDTVWGQEIIYAFYADDKTAYPLTFRLYEQQDEEDEDHDTKYELAREIVTGQHLESTLLEALVEILDTTRVEALCGEKHAHGNGDQRFQRAGTDTRTAVTTAGDHEFTLHYVEDTAADQDEAIYFRPVEDTIDFDGQNRYQQDIAAKSVDLATSLSYRDAADHGDGIETKPSPTTINRRSKEYGSKLKQFLPDCVAGIDADAVVADGTKCHSQDDDRSYHSVQATLGEDTDDDSRSLLDLSVNADWDETAADDAVWLVSAMALSESTGEAAADRQVSSVPTTQELDCQNCGRATDHRFKTHESVPDDSWTGQPIWECRVCGAAGYGPSLVYRRISIF